MIAAHPTSPRSSTARPVCVVTGGTSGIGRASVRQFAAAGCEVVFTGRNTSAGTTLAQTLSREYSGSRFEFIAADLSSLASVRDLAGKLRARCPRLDVLVNNAGARFDRYAQTPDGFEQTIATNHLGHFLLTTLLLDCVLAAPAGRVITVSSRRHRFVKKTSPWLETKENFERWEVYSRAKLANALFGFELARRLDGTKAVSNVVDPGIVSSNFARNNGLLPWLKHIVSSWRAKQLVSCDHAAATIVYAGIAPETAGRTGRYFFERAETEPAPIALDRALAAQLWRASVQWTGLQPAECRAWDRVGLS